MLAKLTLYPEDSAQKSYLDSLLSGQTGNGLDCQWKTQDFTTGKLIDLLICLDELGFLSVNPDASFFKEQVVIEHSA